MMLTTHTFVGVAIGSSIGNPLISVPLSFVMHYVGDKVPHWDFYSNTSKKQKLEGWRPLAVMLDLMLGVAVGLTVTYYALWVKDSPFLAFNIFLSGIASAIPDALEGPYVFFEKEPNFLKPFTRFQKALQFQAPLPWGVLTQVVVVLVSLSILAKQLLLA